jgi:hypothetical protein
MLHTEGCPHAATYLPHLRRLVAAAGLDWAVTTQLVVDDEQAQRELFLGSPTIRVDGVDVDPSAEERKDYGLTCRLYVTADGPQGHPPDVWVMTRLQRS